MAVEISDAVNKVIDGVVAGICREFGEDYDIYTNDVPQNLNTAAFSVRVLDAKIDRFLNNKFERFNLVEIDYFPESTSEPREEIQGILDRLYMELEVISVAGVPVRGIKMDSKIVDNVLVFLIHYNFYTYMKEHKEYMEELTQTINAK